MWPRRGECAEAAFSLPPGEGLWADPVAVGSSAARSVIKGNLSQCPFLGGHGAYPSHRLPRQDLRPSPPRDKLGLELSLSPPLCPRWHYPPVAGAGPLVVRSPRTSQPWLVCLQTLLSKYNQQYHKLFKDIPLEEVVLKGEPSPWCDWTGAWSA